MNDKEPKVSDLSLCCHSPAKVIHGGEGTSYYRCTKCDKPCDINPDVKIASLSMKTNEPSREIGWENDFYEVLPIVCSPLTADAKVARIKIIFEKLLAAAKAEGGKEMLEKAIFLIKAPKHCYVQSCSRCEEQERAINILTSLLPSEGTKKE